MIELLESCFSEFVFKNLVAAESLREDDKKEESSESGRAKRDDRNWNKRNYTRLSLFRICFAKLPGEGESNSESTLDSVQ